MTSFAHMLGLVAIVAVVSGQLEAAQTAVNELRFADALKVLAPLDTAPSLSREDNLKRLHLKATSLAMLKRPQAAAVFRELIWLDPDMRMGEEYGPKVRTPFLEARAWVEDNAGLQARTVRRSADGAQLLVPKDPLGLIRRLEVTWRDVDGPHQTELPLGQASCPTPWSAGTTEATARAWSAQGWLLFETALLTPAESLALTAASTPTFRAPMWAAFSVGLAALAAALVLEVRTQQAYASVNRATRDDQGHITGLTQLQALALEQQVNREQPIKGALYGLAGAGALTGVVFALLGTRAPVKPTAHGLLFELHFDPLFAWDP